MALVFFDLRLVGRCLDLIFLITISVVFPFESVVVLFLRVSITLFLLLSLITVRHLAIALLSILIFESLAKIRESQKSNSFYAKKIPSIPVISYIERILKYSKMEEATLIVMLIYIDRLCENNNFLLTENNIHR